MKKFVSLFLIAILIFSFTACGDESESSNNSTSASDKNIIENPYDFELVERRTKKRVKVK